LTDPYVFPEEKVCCAIFLPAAATVLFLASFFCITLSLQSRAILNKCTACIARRPDELFFKRNSIK
jgi:hypothetical protein